MSENQWWDYLTTLRARRITADTADEALALMARYLRSELLGGTSIAYRVSATVVGKGVRLLYSSAPGPEAQQARYAVLAADNELTTLTNGVSARELVKQDLLRKNELYSNHVLFLNTGRTVWMVVSCAGVGTEGGEGYAALIAGAVKVALLSDFALLQPDQG